MDVLTPPSSPKTTKTLPLRKGRKKVSPPYEGGGGVRREAAGGGKDGREVFWRERRITDEAVKYDQQRESFIQSLGIQVIRFTNLEIRKNIDEVLCSISEMLTP